MEKLWAEDEPRFNLLTATTTVTQNVLLCLAWAEIWMGLERQAGDQQNFVQLMLFMVLQEVLNAEEGLKESTDRPEMEEN